MSRNPLYPVFLKLDVLNILIVGAGEVGYEKLFFLLKNSPEAKVTLVAKEIHEDVWHLVKDKINTVEILKKSFAPEDIEGHQMVVAATADNLLNRHIYEAAKKQNVLINVADTPSLCDFYLGAIVSRGPLKIAISTNGQSPTLAKRIRQFLEGALPAETEQLIKNLKLFRDQLTGDFATKVKSLNQATAGLIDEEGRKKAWDKN